MTYKEHLANPKWQQKRLLIFERDKFACHYCGDTTTELHVHHTKYDLTKMAWEYPNYIYQTLCKDCHKAVTIHIEEHGNADEFDAIKINKRLIIYSKGKLQLPVGDRQRMTIAEGDTVTITQFLINNWLKNG